MIHAIDDRSVDQITSGQVVTNLASALKELVENAVDAGATVVEVNIQNHGRDGFSVQDNGSGIAPEDFGSVAKRHATSKLSSVSDLAMIRTLGFRGEALASLCALAEVHITTNSGDAAGHELEFDAKGNVISETKVARPRGTTVYVSDLFRTVPVRRRDFERNAQRELTKAIALLQEYALLCPVRLTVEHNNKNRRSATLRSQGATLLQRIACVYGASRTAKLMEVKLALEDMGTDCTVTGYISKPVFGMGLATSDRQLIAVNGRPSKQPKIVRAVVEVYKQFNLTEAPFFVLDFRMDPARYDVNVSPDKRELLLHNEAALVSGLRDALVAALDVSGHSVPRSTMDVPSPKRQRQTKLSFAAFAGSGAPISQSFDEYDTLDEASSDLENAETHRSTASDSSDSSGEAAHLKADQPPTQARNAIRDGQISAGDTQIPLSPVDAQNDYQNETNASSANKSALLEYKGSTAVTSSVGRSNSLVYGRQIDCNDSDSPRNEPEVTDSSDSQRSPCPEDVMEEPDDDNKDDDNNEHEEGKEAEAEVAVASYDVAQQSSLDGDEIEREAAEVMSDCCCSNDNSGLDAEAGTDGESVDFTSLGHSLQTSETPAYAGSAIPPQDVSSPLAPTTSSPSPAGVKSELPSAPSSPQRTPSHLKVRVASSQSIDVSEHLSQKMTPVSDRIVPPSQPRSLNHHIHLPVSLADIKKAKEQAGSAPHDMKTLRKLAVDEEGAEERLSLSIRKQDFQDMEVVGQFNLGFILVVHRKKNHDDLFVIDQHASDEIYNFERLQRSTILSRQPLVTPHPLELSAVEELTVAENLGVFENNGFSIQVSASNPPGKQCSLVSVPFSKNTVFDEKDVHDLLSKIVEDPENKQVRCSKLRAMLAMRACRSSIMIGKPLSLATMKQVVHNLGTLDRPWNCPHGRPTLRHITTLS